MIVGAGAETQKRISSGSTYYDQYPFIISYGTPSASLNWALRDTYAIGKYAIKIQISPNGARIVVLYDYGEFLTFDAAGNKISSKKLSNSYA